MKKILNKPEDFVRESISGIINAHSDKLSLLNDDYRIVVRNEKKKNKVAIVTAGGSGHLPLFLGYVGYGLLDACIVGNVFASPSSQKMYEAIKYVNEEKGVLCLFGNYGGDKMNFSMAQEMAEFDDIKVKQFVVVDDISSSSDIDKRRGVAGLIYAYKIAGAASELGYSLDEILEVLEKYKKNTRTMGVALTPCIIPEVGKSNFEIKSDEMEIGMGIHGEKGIKTEKIKKSSEIVNIILEKIETEIILNENDKVSILVNGLGATSLEELYIVYSDIYKYLENKKVKIIKPHIGEYATSMEMAGLSISVLKLDDELEKLLNYTANTPFYNMEGK